MILFAFLIASLSASQICSEIASEICSEIVYAKRLKESRSPATANTLASERGEKTFQPKRISWSYRYRGKAAHPNKKQLSFGENQRLVTT